jgi:hypothetical protein
MTQSQSSPEGTCPTPRASDCTCLNFKCKTWGNCEECVRIHRTHQHHLPECLQPALRSLLAPLATQVELRVSDARPPASVDEAKKRGMKVY